MTVLVVTYLGEPPLSLRMTRPKKAMTTARVLSAFCKAYAAKRGLALDPAELSLALDSRGKKRARLF